MSRTALPASRTGGSPVSLGRFRTLAFLGRGGFSEVWRVADPFRPGEPLALKRLAVEVGHFAGAPEAEGRLVREFRVGTSLQHPVIVETLEIGLLEDEGFGKRRPYILTEFVPGEPLRPFWKAADLSRVAVDLLDALQAIHAAGWRHGDLHPANVLIDRSSPEGHGAAEEDGPRVRLLDFGLTQALDAHRSPSSVGGVPRYLAPEILRGQPADHRADLYALGLLLFECLEGSVEVPPGDFLLEVHQGRFVERVRRAAIDEPLGSLIRALLEPEPSARIQSASEAMDLLRRGQKSGRLPGGRSVVPRFEAAAPVGRTDYFEVLDELLSRVTKRRGGPYLVAIEGGAGLGKSRLIRESLLTALARGIRGISLAQARAAIRAVEGGATMEAAAWTDRPAAPHRSSEGMIEPEAIAWAADGSHRLREAEAILSYLSGEPTVLHVDDFDEASVEERELLRAIVELAVTHREQRREARGSGRLPLFLLSATPRRMEDRVLSAIWKRFLSLPWASRHRLSRWRGREDSQYLDQVLGRARQLGAAEDWLRQEASGRPGRWQLLLRQIARKGLLRLEGAVWVCDPEAIGAEVELPDERERILGFWKSLTRRGRDVWTLLAMAAEFRQTLSIASLGLPFPAREMREALDAWRVSELGASSDATTLPTVDRSLTLRRRERVWILRQAGRAPRRAARRLLATSASLPLAERLYHRLHVEAVDLAAVEGVAETEGHAFERLLALHSRSRWAALEDRLESARRLAEILALRGDRRGAQIHLQRALPLAASDRDAATLRVLLGETETLLAELASAEARLEEAARLLGDQRWEDSRWIYARAVLALRQGDRALVRSLAKEGVRRFGGLPAFHNLQGTLQLEAGDLEAARTSFVTAGRLADEKGSLAASASAATNLARVLLRTGDSDRGVELLRGAAAHFEKAGVRSQAALALGNLGVTLRRSGRFEEALVAFQRAIAIQRELGDPVGMALLQASLAVLTWELGLPGAALRKLQAAEEIAESGGAAARVKQSPVATVCRALISLDLGLVDAALELRQRHRELSGGKPERLDADAVLLDVRLALAENEGLEPGLEEALGREPLGAADAGWLFELAGACREAEDGERIQGSGREALAAKARLALKSLAARCERASVLDRLLTLATAPGETGLSRADAEFLWSLGKCHPRRDIRGRALVALLRRGEPTERIEAARSLLEGLIEEWMRDVPPEYRRDYRNQPRVKEAMKLVMAPLQPTRRDTEDSTILSEVFRLTREILVERDVQPILRKIVDAAISLTGAERGFLALREKSGLRLTVARSGGSDLVHPEDQISHTILERAVSERVARITTDAREDVDFRSVASVEDLGLRSVICVPLVARRRSVLGVLYLDHPLEKGVFGSRELELVESFCAQAVIAWREAEARREKEALLRQLREAKSRLEGELALTRREARRRRRSGETQFEGIVAVSRSMRDIFQWIEVVAPTEIPVLIQGESGVGKELVARAVYRSSRRSDRPFVAENCGAVPAGLLESILFGHVKGAFTGAERDQVGIFTMAHEGTLFLDEIAELPAELQTRLLRVLQEREVRPLGSRNAQPVDVRVIAATNRDLRTALADGSFREDLYYRLQGAEIVIPPLRERPEDIPVLVDHFLGRGQSEPAAARTVTAEAMDRLTRYAWPGNVRELENEIRRAALLSLSRTVDVEHLSPAVREGISPAAPRSVGAPERVRSLREAEREAILAALSHFDGHRGKTAQALGISRSTLYLKLKELG